MKRSNLVLCGAIFWNDELQEIMCDIEDGECYFNDPYSGDILVGELSVSDPFVMKSVDSMGDFLKKNDLLGAIYTKSGVYVIISETVAELRPMSKVTIPSGDTRVIDLNMDAVFEDEEDLEDYEDDDM